MSTAVEHRAPMNGIGTPDNKQSAPRFTAINGHSPPDLPKGPDLLRSSHPPPAENGYGQGYGKQYNLSANHSRQPTPGLQRRDSESSLGKRKHSASGEQSPVSTVSLESQKKRRVSPPNGHQEHPPAIPNGTADSHIIPYPSHDHHRMSIENRDRYPNEQPWHHQRNGSMTSEAQIAEALQRETQQMGPPTMGGVHLGTPQLPTQQQHTPGTHGPVTPGPGVTAPMMQKQRKRNFSNRTKTGCLTCRERKKKCDEGKPCCHNCERGGFLCKGYSQTNPVYKVGDLRGQPPLQAKNGFYDQPYSYPPPPHAPRQGGPDFYEHSQRYSEGHPGRPMSLEEERDLRNPSAQPSNNGPPGPPSSNPPDSQLRSRFGSGQWTEPSPPGPYPPDQAPRPDYSQAMPPFSEISRQQKTLPPPAPMHPASHHGSSQPSQYSNPRTTAQLALEQTQSRPAPPAPMARPEQEFRTEKEKMLNGIPFNGKDPQLKRERQDCAVAVYRFNKNAIDPTNLSEVARREQFRQIVEPHGKAASSESNTTSPSPKNNQAGGVSKSVSISGESPGPIGHVGANVEVDAPFYCNYGYNIRIGDDVEIGANCRIYDECPVEIGARTVIASDVKIITSTVDFRNPRPPGTKRLMYAKKIVIGEDCFIGAGTIILPGYTIGSGAVVGAGTMVNSHIPSPVVAVSKYDKRNLTSSCPTWHQQRAY